MPHLRPIVAACLNLWPISRRLIHARNDNAKPNRIPIFHVISMRTRAVIVVCVLSADDSSRFFSVCMLLLNVGMLAQPFLLYIQHTTYLLFVDLIVISFYYSLLHIVVVHRLIDPLFLSVWPFSTPTTSAMINEYGCEWSATTYTTAYTSNRSNRFTFCVREKNKKRKNTRKKMEWKIVM